MLELDTRTSARTATGKDQCGTQDWNGWGGDGYLSWKEYARSGNQSHHGTQDIVFHHIMLPLLLRSLKAWPGQGGTHDAPSPCEAEAGRL